MKRVLVFSSLISLLLFTSMAIGRVGGGDITYTPKKAKSVVFSHDFHSKDLGHACQRCHPSLYVTKEKDKSVTMAEMNQGKSCGACHNGKEAFTSKGNCSKCHK